jgi:dihydropteroate synthase
MSEDALLLNIENLLAQGADLIDLGACSTRPGSVLISMEDEWCRLRPALQAIRAHFPNIVISVDTFRSGIAEKAVLLGADMINDVYGGLADERMWDVVAEKRVPYVLTHGAGISAFVGEDDNTMSLVLDFFQSKLDYLRKRGVVDVIIDPGLGFGKTERQNYKLLQELDLFSTLHAPVLVGVSRKSMLYKPLALSSSDVLPATIAANTIALERGASILRVHDVDAAKQAISVYLLTHKN